MHLYRTYILLVCEDLRSPLSMVLVWQVNGSLKQEGGRSEEGKLDILFNIRQRASIELSFDFKNNFRELGPGQ